MRRAEELRAQEFQVRVTPKERALIDDVAAAMRRNPSDAMRYLVYSKAEELGILPPAPAPRREREQEQVA